MPDISEAPDPAVGWERVKTVAILFVGFEVVTLILYLVAKGPEKLLQHGVRTLVAAALAWALVRRQKWARWVILALAVIGTWNTAPVVGALWRSNEPRLSAVIATLMILVYIVIVRILLWSPDLRAYLASGWPERSDP